MLHAPSISTHVEVMFFDTDCGGVVHNLAYLRMIETARTRLAAKLGMNLREMARTHLYAQGRGHKVNASRPDPCASVPLCLCASVPLCL